MRVLVDVLIARLSPEDHGDGSKAVERGEQSGEQTDQIEKDVVIGDMQQNSIFREKAGQKWQAGEGRGADQEKPERRRHLGAQISHLANVQLSVGKAMHDIAGCQKEKRLKEGMGYKVKDGKCVCPYAYTQHHEAQLRYR